MRHLLFLVCLAIVLAGCAGQPSPQAAPTATKIAQAPSPTATLSPTPTPTATPTKTPTPTPTASRTPTATQIPEPQVYVTVQKNSSYASPGGEVDGYFRPGIEFTILKEEDGWLYIRASLGGEGWIQVSKTAYIQAPKCEVERCESYQDIALYWNYSDQASFSRLVPGTNKAFIVIERRDGRMFIEVTEPGGDTWQAWADDLPGTYGPLGGRPIPTPTPQPPPYPVCEAPHWPDRTPDRKTGVICDLTTWGCYKYIREPGTVSHRYFRASGMWTDDCWARSGRITDIDRQTGMITFDVGNGLIIRRFLTWSTWVQMWVHEYTRDMLLTGDECPYGGNLCDLEVGDAVRIYFQTEAEARDPDPEPNELLFVTIVQ